MPNSNTSLRLTLLAISTSLLLVVPTSEASPPKKAARYLFVPAGTPIRTVIRQTIGSESAHTGDVISAELVAPIEVAGGLVAAEGSRVEGRVIEATSSGRLSRPAFLEFEFTQLTPKGGRPVRISTTHYVGKGEEHTKNDIGYIAGGAAVGALVGQLIGKNTQGTLEGAAGGLVAGTAAAALTGSKELQIESGRVITVNLERGIRVKVPN